MIAEIEFPGGKSFLKTLSLRAALNGGLAGEAILEECWHEAARNARAAILIGNQRFDIVVRDYHTPWSAKHQWISFCDPVTAADPFGSEAFHAQGLVSYADVVASRKLKVTAPKSFADPRWKQVAVDQLGLPEVLSEICARQGWHWHYHDGRIEMGPLSVAAAVELTDTSNEGDCHGGFILDVHLAIPKLGERVKVRTHGDGPQFREGFVASVDIDLPSRPLATRLVILEEPIPPSPLVSTGTSQRTATVRSLVPLQVEIDEAPGLEVRGQLIGLKTKKCRLEVPLQEQDSVEVEWPRHAITTELLNMRADGVLDISLNSLTFHADEFDVAADKMNVVAKEVNFDER